MSPSPPRDPNSPANGAPREEGSPSASGTGSDRLRSAAWRIVLLFGVVSLFADVTYEGLRSVVG
ncbi:MAG: hypothetical protein KM296_07150, partial [Brockia lithotrophica]|nr:hypothetical protein [Brockia lithotrophica]